MTTRLGWQDWSSLYYSAVVSVSTTFQLRASLVPLNKKSSLRDGCILYLIVAVTSTHRSHSIVISTAFQLNSKCCTTCRLSIHNTVTQLWVLSPTPTVETHYPLHPWWTRPLDNLILDHSTARSTPFQRSWEFSFCSYHPPTHSLDSQRRHGHFRSSNLTILLLRSTTSNGTLSVLYCSSIGVFSA